MLTLEDPATNRLKLNSLERDNSAAFLDKYSKFLVMFEKVFLVLVIIDAAITATKHANMEYKEHKLALEIWQVTSLFVSQSSTLIIQFWYYTTQMYFLSLN